MKWTRSRGSKRLVARRGNGRFTRPTLDCQVCPTHGTICLPTVDGNTGRFIEPGRKVYDPCPDCEAEKAEETP